MAPFFARRFAAMDWNVLTPKGSAMFVNGELAVSGVPAKKPDVDDPAEAPWLTCYAAIFNPARLNPVAMRAEMPKKYWANLPEGALIPWLIPSLIAGAPARVAAMSVPAKREPPAFHTRPRARNGEEPSPKREDTLLI
jgi:uracil-DNA glycosylase